MFQKIPKKAKILIIADNLWYLGEGMLGPLFAIFTEKVGGDILDITWAWAVYLIISGILIMFVGQLSDKVSKEKLVVGGYFLNAICTFGYIFVSSTYHLFIIQIGLGIATALATPTWNALYDKYNGQKHLGYSWGMADGQAEIVTGIALVIGGIILVSFSFVTLFIIMGIIQTASAFYMLNILKKN